MEKLAQPRKITKPSRGGFWGIMGGTFDPVHFGHLIMAESVMHSMNADGMLFVPAATHPFKPQERLANLSERMEMVKLAIAGNDRFLLEEPPENSGYTIDLIDFLQNKYSTAKFFLPIGSDLIEEFRAWYKYDEIERRIEIVIAARPGYPLKLPQDGTLQGAEKVIIPQYDIKSSDIRKRVRNRMSINYMVPEAVKNYIYEKGMYAG